MRREQQVCDNIALRDVADAIAGHGALRCEPQASVDTDTGVATLTVRFWVSGDYSPDTALEALELFGKLEQLSDMCQLRAIAQRYNIDPARLEALLPDSQ